MLHDELRRLLCEAACRWAGVPLAPEEVARRTDDLALLFDGAGAVGPRHWSARLARKRADRWAADIVVAIRSGRLVAPGPSAARVIAEHRDLEGALLEPRVAGVELVNVLRPTIAVSVFLTFAAHALHLHPEERRRLIACEPGHARAFAQEVRRWYPFFPAVAARVAHDFDWHGWHFVKGRRVMLDLHGIDHDPRLWEQPEEFAPDRFLARRDGDPFRFVPQGGGDPAAGHRCVGEEAALALIELATRWFAGRMRYEVPEQDLALDLARLPALPRSRFRIRGVVLAEPAGA